MTSSPDVTQKAVQTLEKIFGLLDEKRLRSEIDEPVDKVLGDFELDSADTFSVKFFHETISEFVLRVYEQGLRVPQQLSRIQALAEAIFILEQNYVSSFGRGYEAALLDAKNPGQDGLYSLLCSMAEIIKARERKKYVTWVFAIQVDRTDWTTRCEIAQAFIDRHRPFLPPDLLQCGPAQLADELTLLIAGDINTEGMLSALLST